MKIKSKFKTPSTKSKGAEKGSSPSGGRRRRTRCRKCEACIRDDCGECNFCKDMKKYGGPGRMKQTCVSRQCMAPVLPHTAVCMICWKDDRVKVEDHSEETVTTLMECGICWEIVHPDCLKTKYENLDNDGNINEDLPNSWECAKCCHDGKQGQLKPRVKKCSKSKAVSHEDDEDTEDANTSLNGFEGKRVTAKVGLSPKGKASSKIQSGAELVKKKYGKFKKMELQRKRKFSSNSPQKSADSSNGHQEESPKRTVKRSRLSEPLPTKSSTSLPSKNAFSSPESVSPDTPSRRPRREGVVYNSPDDKTGTPQTRKRRFRKSGSQRTPETSPEFSRATPSQSKGKKRKRRKDNYEISPSTSANVATDIADSSDTIVDTPSSSSSKRICKPEYHSNPGHIKLKEVSVVLERYIVRPAPLPPPPDFVTLTDGSQHVLDRIHWMLIFSFLPQRDLSRCLSVCKTWNRWCNHPSLWKVIDLSKKRVIQAHLMAIVRHQPQSLSFVSSVITQKQIDWLTARLPQLKSLNLSKLSWAIICGLCSYNCPLLKCLNLSWATGIMDNCVRDLVSPPVNRRPGMKDVSRLYYLEQFFLAGTEITDTTLAFLSGQLKNLSCLDLSYCVLITDNGLTSLLSDGSCLRKTLKELYLSGCKNITESCLPHLHHCEKLIKVAFNSCPQISFKTCKENIRHFQQKNLIVTSDKTICRP